MIVLPLILLGLSWLQEGIDQLLLGGRWNLAMGPGTPWWTLLTAPFSHGDLGHLIGNSIVFLPLSYLVLLKSLRGYVAVWIAVILLEIPLWLFWPVGSHGLSGVVYGLLGYLVLIGFLERQTAGHRIKRDCRCLLRKRLTRIAALGLTRGSELDWPRKWIHRWPFGSRSCVK